MRPQSVRSNGFEVRAIGGSQVVLLAIDSSSEARKGLLGFALKPTDQTEGPSYWLTGLKAFREVVPFPQKGARYSTLDHPIQSFLWGDYSAKPNHAYRFTIRPVYGKPCALDYGTDIDIDAATESESGQTHAVYFNRGSIASQVFSEKFGNKGPANPEDPGDPTTVWLSRGLLEAALGFINDTHEGEKLRVAAYEFSYAPILSALAKARTRGVDVVVVYEAGKETKDGKRVDTQATAANAKAIKKARLPQSMLRKRTKRNDIPHNKFMVRISGDSTRTAVWTGSTNFTPSGFLGQTNVGHIVRDSPLAQRYLEYWRKLANDTEWDTLRDWNEGDSPNPGGNIPPNTIVPLFSPRRDDALLDWYAQRILDAQGTVMFTAAFGVNGTLAKSFAVDKPFLRFILREKPLLGDARALLTRDKDVQIAYGAALGRKTIKAKVPGWQLDKWFLDEDHYRYEGNIFYIHTKILLVDPLSDDPLVISGSANFSKNSLVSNDENMLLIRGDTRVADLYMTEFDRIFRHFYFRDVANELALHGEPHPEAIFLDSTDECVQDNFSRDTMKSKRRRLFFPQSAN